MDYRKKSYASIDLPKQYDTLKMAWFLYRGHILVASNIESNHINVKVADK